MLDRRMLLAGAATLAAARPAPAQPAGEPARMPIWPKGPPGGIPATAPAEMSPGPGIYQHVQVPTLSLFHPEKPNGRALLIMPGGGYVRVAVGQGTHVIARRFADAGYVAGILVYRQPADGWAAGPLAPLQDAQRAMRLMRAMAAREGVPSLKLGVVGFSAGGHLAASLATRADATYAPVDEADSQPFRPDLAGLMYPVMTMEGPHAHGGSRTQLLGAGPTPDQLRALSPNLHVGPGMPPTFLAHALDDRVVKPENSLAMLAALREKSIPAECHLFENGGHGFGILNNSTASAPWPDLFLAFARRHDL